MQFEHHLKHRELIITQGFLATLPNGAPTTLGRDGSDYTASLLGAALNVKEIHITLIAGKVMNNTFEKLGYVKEQLYYKKQIV